ncbi:MAG: ATP-dependent zinc metalloprotease FtsH, partial [Ignavibacterium sp.]
MITYALGGRAAEKLIFNHFTTGAGNDIEKATNIARKMVCEWGMSEKLGPLAYGAKEEEIFLGREIQRHRDYSEKTAQEIDEEVRRIIRNAEQRAENILKENIDLLHKLSKELLEREILDGEEIDAIIKGQELPPVKKPEKSNGEEEIPEYVKKLMEQRTKKESAPKDESN